MANFNPLSYTGGITGNTTRLGVVQFDPVDFSVTESGVVSLGGTGSLQTINTQAPVAGNYTLAGTANQITKTDTAGTTTFSLPSAITFPGSATATTSLTATLGAITASNGNVVMSTAGNGIRIKAGTNARIGVGAVLVGGTLTISNTSVTASTVILPVVTVLGTVTAPKALYVTKNAGVGFTVTSADATDTSTFDWYMVESI